MREKIFSQHFPDVSNLELFEVMNKYKGLFFMRRRRLLLLKGKGQEVIKDRHTHAQEALKMHQVAETNRKAERESETGKPDEVYDSEEEPVIEKMDPIDVDALDGENVTQDAPSEGTG